jgi:hypothetical protein
MISWFFDDDGNEKGDAEEQLTIVLLRRGAVQRRDQWIKLSCYSRSSSDISKTQSPAQRGEQQEWVFKVIVKRVGVHWPMKLLD